MAVRTGADREGRRRVAARTACPASIWFVGPAAATLRTYGPLHRFDPHPPPTRDHGPQGPYAWYGAFLFGTAVCERLARGEGVVDICPGLSSPPPPQPRCTTSPTGGVRRLGADPTRGARRLRYWSAHQPDAHGGGVNVVLWRKHALLRGHLRPTLSPRARARQCTGPGGGARHARPRALGSDASHDHTCARPHHRVT